MLGEDGVEAEDHIVRAGARRGALDPQVRRQICVREFCATRHFISFRGSSVNFDLARRPEQFDAAIPVGRLAHIDRDLLAGNGAGRTVCHADAALCGQVDLHDVDLAGVEAGGGQYLGFGEDSRAARSGLGKGITASRSFIPYAPVPEGRARAQIAVSRQYEHVATVMDADILPCLFDIDLQRIDGCRVGFARAGEGYINRSWLDAVQAQRREGTERLRQCRPGCSDRGYREIAERRRGCSVGLRREVLGRSDTEVERPCRPRRTGGRSGCRRRDCSSVVTCPVRRA